MKAQLSYINNFYRHFCESGNLQEPNKAPGDSPVSTACWGCKPWNDDTILRGRQFFLMFHAKSWSKHFLLAFLFLLLSPVFTSAQDGITRDILTYSTDVRDSLLSELVIEKDNKSRVWLLYELAGIYRFNQPDSGIYYGIKAWELARQINYPDGQVAAMRFVAIAHIALGLYGRALQWDLEAIKLADQYGLLGEKVILLAHLGEMYIGLEDYPRAIEYYKASVLLSDSAQDHYFYVSGLHQVGEAFLTNGELDSAKYYVEKAFNFMSDHMSDDEDAFAYSDLHSDLGRVYHAEGKKELALTHFRKSFEFKHLYSRSELLSAIDLAMFYYKEAKLDSSERYAQRALDLALGGDFYIHIIEASDLLANIYKKEDINQSLKFKTMAMAYQDSLFKLARSTAFQNLIDFEEREQELAAAEEEFVSQLRTNAFLGSSFTLIVIAFLLYRNNRAKQKSKQKIENAYNELKSTQSQLIHSEKMASLGELTAGIAHEIQNPLNFVNNFSDVNKELIEELNEEIDKGNTAEVKAITKDLLDNEDKVAHHGKRAEAIVKSMLQHSRTGSGEKEMTDVNALADEYLRLAYHGLRAKDQSFNADFKTELDDSLPKVNVVPQDIGRVLLNLINNAFQAVSSQTNRHSEPALAGRQSEESRTDEVPNAYKPEVVVSTRKTGKSVEITVKDNGPGIPEDIKDKIFQPFFTTKPAL